MPISWYDKKKGEILTTIIALTGKSGSGKTTLTKAFWRILAEKNPDKSFLLIDNDLTSELGHTFGHDIRETVYGIRSGKHEYKTGIPENMSKQEFIEWALEDILFPLNDNTEILVTWFVGSKDCRCPITGQLNEALKKLISRYDYVIIDCEFDLKYFNQLVDVDIDLTLIVANPTEESAHLAKRIEEFSAKYAIGGQMGLIINKVQNNNMEELYALLKKYDLDILGTVPYDENIENITRNSDKVIEAIKSFFFRLNLPQ